MFDVTVSDFQKSDVAVVGNTITGTLKYLSTGSPAATYGPGNFLALAWSNLDSHTTSLIVIRQADANGNVTKQEFDISGLTLETQ